MLRWIVELGRVDIAMEVSMLASMMALSQKMYLEQTFHMFGDLNNKHNAEMVFAVPDFNEEDFPKQDWDHTPNPKPLTRRKGTWFFTLANDDSDHASDSIFGVQELDSLHIATIHQFVGTQKKGELKQVHFHPNLWQ